MTCKKSCSYINNPRNLFISNPNQCQDPCGTTMLIIHLTDRAEGEIPQVSDIKAQRTIEGEVEIF